MNKWTKRDILDLWKPVYPDLFGIPIVALLTLTNGSFFGSLFYVLICLVFMRAVLSFLLWMQS